MKDWKRLEFATSARALEGCPRQPLPEVAFSGRSNVGKSTLLNTLALRRGLAKTSQKPGKTRLLNFFSLGTRAHLVDLPGYGYAAVSHAMKDDWARFMGEYLEGRPQLAGLVQLLDCRHEPTAQDRQMVDWLRGRDLAFLLVMTKADKISRGKRQKQASLVRKALSLQADAPLQFFSAQTGEGKSEIIAWIEGALAAWKDPGAR